MPRGRRVPTAGLDSEGRSLVSLGASMRRALTPVLLGLLAAGTLATTEAHAQSPRRGTYRFRTSVDLPVMAATTPILAAWFLGDEFASPHCAPRCDPSTLNALDRPVAGRFAPGWQRVSDVGLLSFGALAITTLALHEGVPTSWQDTAIVLESVMVANATAILFNFAVRRPRPLVYGDEASLEQRMRGNAGLSFFSGHTANAFAVAVAMFQVLRHTARPALAYGVLGVGLSVATFVAISRVMAGAHFPSDVIAGAIVGSASGWAVPALHGRQVFVAPTPLVAGAGLSLAGTF